LLPVAGTTFAPVISVLSTVPPLALFPILFIAIGLRLVSPTRHFGFRGRRGIADLGAEITPFDLDPFRETTAILYGGPWVAERLLAIKELVAKDRKRSTRWSATSSLAAKTYRRRRLFGALPTR
jgi:hypothetical protein